MLIQRLEDRGLYLHYTKRSWSAWDALRLEGVALHRTAKRDQPVVEMSALTVDFALLESATNRAVVSRWRSDDATLKLHDDAGIVTFEHVSAAVVVRAGEIEIPQMESRNDGLAFAFSGKLLLAHDSERIPGKADDFTLDLSTVRAVLTVAAFKADGKPFAIQGTYFSDFRDTPVVWQADLAGTGKAVEWQGVPLRDAIVSAQLSNTGMKLTSNLQFARGSAKASVSRSNWKESPLLITGSFADSAGQTNDFSASYESTAKLVTIDSLRGRANLLEFAGNFPVLVPNLPTWLQIQPFPDIAVQDFAWSFGKTSPAWTIGAIQSRSPSDITITVADQPLKVDGLEGQANFADKAWKIQLKSSHSGWNGLDVGATEINATLAGSQVKSSVNLHLAKGSVKLELTSRDWTRASWQFTGSLTDSRGQADRFSGAYSHEPKELSLARLDGRANLLEFTEQFPYVAKRIPNALRVRTFPEIAVKDLSWRPGKSPTVAAMRLVSPIDLTLDVKGHPHAIKDLTGSVGFNGKAWQFSRLNGQVLGARLSVDGSYSDGTLRSATVAATNLQLNELKPWLGQAEYSLGAAVLSFDYRGTVCHDPTQLTGSGSIQLEKAPLVHVPLLDQTYQLFSALASVVKRSGAGRLAASFSSAKGVATVSQFEATGNAVKVMAKGTLDLVKRQVSARARGNLRGLIGIATSPLSNTLEMEVSGPLNNMRVRPVGLGGVLTRSVAGTVRDSGKLTGNLVRDGIAVPFKALERFKSEVPAGKPKAAD